MIFQCIITPILTSVPQVFSVLGTVAIIQNNICHVMRAWDERSTVSSCVFFFFPLFDLVFCWTWLFDMCAHPPHLSSRIFYLCIKQQWVLTVCLGGLPCTTRSLRSLGVGGWGGFHLRGFTATASLHLQLCFSCFRLLWSLCQVCKWILCSQEVWLVQFDCRYTETVKSVKPRQHIRFRIMNPLKSNFLTATDGRWLCKPPLYFITEKRLERNLLTVLASVTGIGHVILWLASRGHSWHIE